MTSIRILIVTHAQLSAELGAGQMAINLAEAFREQGHDVTLWSPQPLPEKTRWWQSLQLMRSKLDAFIDIQQPFDLIDSPAALVTQRVSKSALVVVARSVQPYILYMLHGLNFQLGGSIKRRVQNFCNYLYSCFEAFLALEGWRRASYILCLGNLESSWMRRWSPWWQSKLIHYVNALSNADRAALAEVRLYREQHLGDSVRFLWIGRWVAHKGIDVLLDFIVERASIRPQDTFTIAGCGTDAKKDFPSSLLQLGSVTIIPSFKRNQLYSLLASHNAGLFTSRVEGWGLVLNEMLESGMPVFATPVGGVPDLQPFFKEILMPFPPPLEFESNVTTRAKTINDYYRVFNWSRTASVYIESVLHQIDANRTFRG